MLHLYFVRYKTDYWNSTNMKKAAKKAFSALMKFDFGGGDRRALSLPNPAELKKELQEKAAKYLNMTEVTLIFTNITQKRCSHLRKQFTSRRST